jgi:hypothetical protein
MPCVSRYEVCIVNESGGKSKYDIQKPLSLPRNSSIKLSPGSSVKDPVMNHYQFE